jgi:arginine exporter protein ArgO
MKSRARHGVMSLVLAAGIVDSVVLVTAAFAAVVNAYSNHPMLSAWTVLSGVVMLVVLAITATVDER